MVCVYRIKDNYYHIETVLLITRQGKIVELVNGIDDANKMCHSFQSHTNDYIDRHDITRTCVALAHENGDYTVDSWTAFGEKWYDVNLIDSRTGFVGRYAYD